MRNTFWKIWTKTNNEKNATNVLRRVLKKMNRQAQIVSLEPYPNISGHVLRFVIELESETWNDQIIECFHTGEKVAYSWSLTGNVADDPGGFSSKVGDCGVEAIKWSFR